MRITVGDLMNPKVYRLRETETLQDAARHFLNDDLSQVYIISEDEEFLGILTDYALIKARLSGLEWDQQINRLISRSVLTVNAEQDISAVMPLFREGRGDIVPVLHEGLLVGELKRNVVLQMMLALDPSCAFTSLQELDDESILEQQCESDMKQEQLKDEPTVAFPQTVAGNSTAMEKQVPAPYLVKRTFGMITTLNAPLDLFQDQP
ncbi:MAG: CBS domain-containing protein [Planctomycetaceae bacterium]|nr:CBS domain-containing protein [Planctomycetaceae bacterium]